MGWGYPGKCPRYPAPDNVRVGKIFFRGGIPDNVRDTLTQTMSELEKFALRGGGVSQTMSELEKFALQGGGVSQTMSELEKFALQGGGYPGQCPRYPAPDNVRVAKIC